jgi:enoyl-CoA hydratase
MNYSDFQHILFDRREPHILWITLNRPEVLNAANSRLHTELVELWPVIDRDPTVHVAVVTGAGRAFSAGGDLQMVEEAYRDHEEISRILEEARDLVYNMLRCSKPIVSAINGPAVGAGLVVALLADISIAAESARLADGHVRMGVAAGDHAAILWPLLCGMAKAKYYLMTSDFISGPEAERMGLVSLCVPDDELLDRAMAVAADLAAGPRQAIKFTKRALNQWLLQAGPIFDHSLALEMLGFFSEDVLAGVEGLRQKKAPRFRSGRSGGDRPPGSE